MQLIWYFGAKLGDYALNLLLSGESGYIVGAKAEELVKMSFPKERIPRILNFETNDLIQTAKSMGIYFGE